MTPHVYIGYDPVEHDAVLTLEETLWDCSGDLWLDLARQAGVR